MSNYSCLVDLVGKGFTSSPELEDVVLLCDFMGIMPVIRGGSNYSWRDGVHYMTHEESSQAVMVNVWRYILGNKVNDWRWLMEVVCKIENIRRVKDGYHIYNVVIEQYLCKVIQNETGVCVKRVTGVSKVDAVYKCCVSFVKWYMNSESKGK